MTIFYITMGIITYLIVGIIVVILYSRWTSYNPINRIDEHPLGFVIVWPIIVMGLSLIHGIYWINHGLSLLCCYFAKKELK